MTIQQVVAELENIKEQVLNDSKLTTDDMIEAIEDIISNFVKSVSCSKSP